MVSDKNIKARNSLPYIVLCSEELNLLQPVSKTKVTLNQMQNIKVL